MIPVSRRTWPWKLEECTYNHFEVLDDQELITLRERLTGRDTVAEVRSSKLITDRRLGRAQVLQATQTSIVLDVVAP